MCYTGFVRFNCLQPGKHFQASCFEFAKCKANQEFFFCTINTLVALQTHNVYPFALIFHVTYVGFVCIWKKIERELNVIELAPTQSENSPMLPRTIMKTALNNLRSPDSPTSPPRSLDDDLSNIPPGTPSPNRHDYEHLRRQDDSVDNDKNNDENKPESEPKQTNNNKRQVDVFDEIFTPLEDNELDIEPDAYQ